MANDDEILVAGLARVYLAIVGSLAPVDESAALDAAWRDVGYFTPDSLQVTDTPTFATVQSHQSAFPTRTFQTAAAATIQCDLQQFSAANLAAVLGGGTVTLLASGHYKYVPPAIGARNDVAAIVELTDGTKVYRYCIPRCLQTEAATTQFRRTNETTLPLRLAVQGSDVGDPYYILSNDPAFAP